MKYSSLVILLLSVAFCFCSVDASSKGDAIKKPTGASAGKPAARRPFSSYSMTTPKQTVAPEASEAAALVPKKTFSLYSLFDRSVVSFSAAQSTALVVMAVLFSFGSKDKIEGFSTNALRLLVAVLVFAVFVPFLTAFFCSYSCFITTELLSIAALGIFAWKIQSEPEKKVFLQEYPLSEGAPFRQHSLHGRSPMETSVPRGNWERDRKISKSERRELEENEEGELEESERRGRRRRVGSDRENEIESKMRDLGESGWFPRAKGYAKNLWRRFSNRKDRGSPDKRSRAPVVVRKVSELDREGNPESRYDRRESVGSQERARSPERPGVSGKGTRRMSRDLSQEEDKERDACFRRLDQRTSSNHGGETSARRRTSTSPTRTPVHFSVSTETPRRWEKQRTSANGADEFEILSSQPRRGSPTERTPSFGGRYGEEIDSDK